MLLRRTLIAHGGYGTTMGVLSYGVPMVLTPLGADQPLHAERCRALGVAQVLDPRELSAESLARALKHVLQTASFTHRARELQAEIAALPDIHAALADLVAFSTGHGGRPLTVSA